MITLSQRSREQLKADLEHVLRQRFPKDTVDVSDGYGDNVHVMVVSRAFDRMNERQKHDMLWSIVDAADFTDAERSLISLLYPVSPAEIK